LSQTARLGLLEFNELPASQAGQALLGCCSARRWADEVAAGRPYASIDELLDRSARTVTGLGPDDLRQALSGHPRIGAPESVGPASREMDGPAGPAGPAMGAPAGPADREAGAWSGREQAGVDRGDQELMRALAAGNQAYEQRFGHIYLVCATGRSGAELLALLQQRLGHDPAAEWRVVAAELEKINRIRLRTLIGG
jgi:2-oxo-4-hydroxy-4-carboxy-5-ureidoimidazoline decarboxylase